MPLEKGDKVSWQVGGRLCEGVVRDIYIRNEPDLGPFRIGQGRALLVELSDGRKVLKLENELQPIGRKRFG